MRLQTVILAIATPPLLGGCVVKTVADVATAPVRFASSAVDMATTSQSEADEARGREIRRREERLGKLEREYADLADDCDDGDDEACREAIAVRREMDALIPMIPVEQED
jgi:hypothetical protein